MRQLQLLAHGEPSDVIELNTVANRSCQEDVLISMEAARSIHRTLCSSWNVRHPPAFPSPIGAEVLAESPKRARRLIVLCRVSGS